MKGLRKHIKICTRSRRGRRGRRKRSKNFKQQLRFLGVNSAGLRPKLLTFKKVVSELKPSVFFVEETKFKNEGKFKVDGYTIFELVRKSGDGGGGLALGCDKKLHPVWIREGDDIAEALSVVITVKEMKIRCCVGYGPQENDLIDRKNAFWNYMDEEVLQASNNGTGLIMQFDGNLWAGANIIPGDKRKQNRNGKFFEEFLDRNPHLTVVNSLSLCKGLITRTRLRDGNLEESVLDFFVVCDRVLPHVKSMEIDEDKKHILTNYEQVRMGGKASDSDHFTEIMDVDLTIMTEKPERKILFNFKDKEALELFKQKTSQTKEFTDCFKNNLSLANQIEKWRAVLKSHCSTSFKKIRIKKNSKMRPLKPELLKLINQRNLLNRKKGNQSKVDEISEEISKMEAEENRNKIMENFKCYSENPESINLTQMWKLLGKLWPKNGNALPSAKKNHKGKIISDPRELKKLLAKEYKERLRSRRMRPDFLRQDDLKEDIFKLKMKIAESNESPEWNLSDLERALNDLKRNKARDNDGLINELFKLDVIGDDLKQSLLLMCNKIKKAKLIPLFMNFPNITTVPKKGSRLLLKNERGIFRVAVPRYILMRLIYNSKYEEIDENISDCQMGARKGKSCKNNIFIINGIIHDVMKSKSKKPVHLQIYDYAQMFDAINLKKALSDIFDTGLQDDNLVLIYEANKEIHMAVNTPTGLSERQIIKNCVLQGETWGSILASVQVDTIGKECEASGYGYLYKDSLPVSMLGLVDDIIGVTEAGYKAQQMNALINIQTADKGLQFGVDKCKSMLVGKDLENTLYSDLTVDKWNVTHKDDPETGVNELVETYVGQTPILRTEEQKYLGFVLSSKGDNMVNISHMKKKSKGIIRRIFNRLNSLNLQKYYFECALVFLNTMLRSSILYACETYYNLKETEIRQLERIEEGFLRELLKTSKGCPIIQLYLEVGLIPARYEIIRIRLLFLKNILNQNQDSMIFKFLKIQLESLVKGDWTTTCKENLIELDIEESFEDIQKMSITRYKNLLKKKVRCAALCYLTERQRNKGGDIQYPELQMAEYLLPNNSGLSIEDKCRIFEMRNKMVINIQDNFSSKQKVVYICKCDNIEDMKHVYMCEILNPEKHVTEYEEIYSENIQSIKEVYRRFQNNLNERERQLNKNKEFSHAILVSDPLYSTCIDYSNG